MNWTLRVVLPWETYPKLKMLYTVGHQAPTQRRGTEIMTMTKPLAHHVITGLLMCQDCGSVINAIAESDNISAKYLCHGLLNHEFTGCASKPVDASTLDRLIITALLDKVLTVENLQKIVALVKRDPVHEAEESVQQAEAAQQELSSHNRQKGTIMTAVEHRAGTYSQAAKRMSEITGAEADLEAEAREAGQLAATSEYASESDGRIRKYATELSTYLRESNAEETRAFLCAFIAEVLVGAETATIRYSVPSGTGDHDQVVGF